MALEEHIKGLRLTQSHKALQDEVFIRSLKEEQPVRTPGSNMERLRGLEEDEGLCKLVRFNKPKYNYELYDKMMMKNQN